jgi:hypothetical protein
MLHNVAAADVVAEVAAAGAVVAEAAAEKAVAAENAPEVASVEGGNGGNGEGD